MQEKILQILITFICQFSYKSSPSLLFINSSIFLHLKFTLIFPRIQNMWLSTFPLGRWAFSLVLTFSLMTQAGSSAGGKQMDTRHLCFPTVWPHRWQMGQSRLPILRSPSEAVGNSWQRTDSTPGWSRWDLSEWACGCETPVSASIQLVWGSLKCLESTRNNRKTKQLPHGHRCQVDHQQREKSIHWVILKNEMEAN